MKTKLLAVILMVIIAFPSQSMLANATEVKGYPEEFEMDRLTEVDENISQESKEEINSENSEDVKTQNSILENSAIENSVIENDMTIEDSIEDSLEKIEIEIANENNNILTEENKEVILDEKEFYYEETFAADGIRVIVSADKGIIPVNAKAFIEPVSKEEKEKIETLVTEEKSREIEERKSEPGTIFERYENLEASVGSSYSYHIMITYEEEGKELIFVPENKEQISVQFENISISEENYVLQEVELYQADLKQEEQIFSENSDLQKSINDDFTVELNEDLEIMKEDIALFYYKNSLTYSIVIVNYDATATDAMIAAQTKAWDIIQNYADPNYFLDDPLQHKDTMTKEQYLEIQNKAKAITSGCITQYDKIKAITIWIADNIYYDWDYYGGRKAELYFMPYEVFHNGYTVCDGYARLMETMMSSIGIPCMYILGDNHAYNAVYDSINAKWIFVDATWISRNKYIEGKKNYSGYSLSRCFDLSPNQIATLSNHEVYYADGMLYGGIYYLLKSNKETWLNRNWDFYVSRLVLEIDNVVIASNIDGVYVTGIWVEAFKDCNSLKNISIPNSVVTIERHAFQNCSSLKNITIPNSVTVIRERVFWGCSSLKSITIPDKVTEIGDYVFWGCKSLEVVKFLGNAPSIDKSAFYNTFYPLKVYYVSGKTGFTNPWCGVSTQVFYPDKVNGFTKRLYKQVLGRTANDSELTYYEDLLITQQITGADAGKGFVFSPEFINKKLSNSEYIEVLYQTFMGRSSDKAGKAYWKEMLDNGVSREYVFKGFVESTEFTGICNSYGITRGNINLTEPRDQNANVTMFISRCYQKALGRTAELNGLNYYAQEILLKRVTPLQASQNFIFSPEFKNKNLSDTAYVKALYRTFMGREFDQSGLNYHLNRMKNGTSREEILLGFAYSPEFKNIMKGFGL